MEYPLRINKYLAHRGFSTRRGADALIQAGKVLINGRKAELGDKVGPDDQVEVRSTSKAHYTYFAYHKPRGIITHSPRRGEEDAKKNANVGDVFPVGRLDKDSSGLMILTNDGRVTERLLSPEREHEKEYRVRVTEPLKESFKAKMERGVLIEGYKTKPCKVRMLGPKSFSITLTEGKKHQIRRMVTALKNQVDELTRTRILSVRLGDLSPGDARPLLGEELHAFLTNVGLE